MAVSNSVKDQVASIYRNHLEGKFGNRLVFDPIVVVPEFSYYLDDEYLHIYVVVDGDEDGNALDPSFLNSLYRRMRPELLELGVTNIPVDSYIDKNELCEVSDQHPVNRYLAGKR